MIKKKGKLKHSFIAFCVIILFKSTQDCSALNESHPELKLTKVWGPGLTPHKIVMPARYFFIQTRNFSILSQSIQDDFEITIEGTTKEKRPCRIWSNILDRKDDSLIVRYKVYEVCSSISINIKYKNQHVGQSPYQVKDAVYSDDCYCPKERISDFFKDWQCEDVPSKSLKDFEPFKIINWDTLRPKIIENFNKPHAVSLCHYIIKDNKVYRKCYGKYVGFNMFSDSILLSLARKAKLPDVEFFVNLGDWPLSLKNLPEKYPIFSWCGSSDSHDIVMPTYELTESALENMGKVMLDMLSVQGNVEGPWEKRKDKLFWRGRDSNRQRLNLITLSREHPELFNVSLTHFFFFRDEEDDYGPKSDVISFFKFFDYKYQVALDGTVAPYRMPFLLGGGSLVFKPTSTYYEHFYKDLQPNVHFIEIKPDLSNLVEKIQWAKDHDAEAKAIGQNGQKFINENLLPQHVFCYYMHLLNELSKVMTSEVKILEDMELVSQKKSVPCDCFVRKNLNSMKEEL